MTPTKTARSIIAAGTSNAAAGTTRGTLDLRTTFGGLLTLKITNGATGPTVGCTANILVAHNAGATPAAAGAGADWKTLTSVTHIVTANAVGEWAVELSQSVMHVEVEFTGNTGQAVTVEAQFSEVTSIA